MPKRTKKQIFLNSLRQIELSVYEFFPALRSILQAQFLSLILLGMFFIFLQNIDIFNLLDLSNNQPLQKNLITLGSTLLTLGISLPIAIHFQAKHSQENFNIIRACNRAGIKMIIENRKDGYEFFRKSIIEETKKTESLKILGVSFRSLFDPDRGGHKEIREHLHIPLVKIQILLLSPESEPAKTRESIEQNGLIENDVKFTLKSGVSFAVAERLKKLYKDNDYQEKITTLKQNLQHKYQENFRFCLDKKLKQFETDLDKQKFNFNEEKKKKLMSMLLQQDNVFHFKYEKLYILDLIELQEEHKEKHKELKEQQDELRKIFRECLEELEKYSGLKDIESTNLELSEIEKISPKYMLRLAEIAEKTLIEVKTYEEHPIVYMIKFDKCMFVEQYHFGRPDSLEYGSCIGGFVPILQLRRDAIAYDFYDKHFEYLWEKSSQNDLTQQITHQGIKIFVKRILEEEAQHKHK